MILTLEGSAAERRCAVLASLAGVASDLRAICSIAQVGGTWRYADFTWVGDRSVGGVFQTVEGKPFKSPWDPTAPPASGLNAFEPGIERWGESEEALSRLPIWANYYGPAGVRSERRMLVYDGDEFVAWISLSRLGDAPRFSRDEEAALRRAGVRAQTLAIAHHRLNKRELDPGSGHLVVSPSGHLEFACGTSSRWLDQRRLAWLSEATRRVDAGEMIDVIVADGVAARPVRLSGDGASRYLWVLERLVEVRRSPLSRLTPRQREVVECIVVGATVSEAARHLGLSVETTREHLKAAYARLEVGNRIELARAIAAL